MCEIKLNRRSVIELGNLDSKRDWGFAGDYVEGMWKILQQSKPDDFVLATNQTCSIRDFVNICCNFLKIKIAWKGVGLKEIAINLSNNKTIIKINPKYYRPAEVHSLKGNYLKAKKKLKWKPKILVKDLAKLMINEDLSRFIEIYNTLLSLFFKVSNRAW